MNRVTLRDFRVQLAAYASSVGSPLGICVRNLSTIAGLVNVATERLINDPMAPEEGWWGGWGRFLYNVTQGNPFVIAQYGIARLIVLDVCNIPRKIQNGFFEFLDYGEGLKPELCQSIICSRNTQAFDRETVATLAALNGTPQFLRFLPSDSRDTGKTILPQGLDQNGNVITDTDPTTNQTISGEVLNLQMPFTQSLFQFSSVTGIQKDNTFGSVTIQQVDPISGNSAPLSMMAPTETAANYRRYFFDKMPCFCCSSVPPQTPVTAMAKFEYIPIASDPDYLGIPNVPALIAECEACRFETMDSEKAQKLAVVRHQKALSLLFGQLQHYLGNERPAISVNLFGRTHGLRHQPI